MKELRRTDPVCTPLGLRHLEQLLVSELLVAARHHHSGHLREDRHAAAIPRHVREATDLIEAHAGDPLTVVTIAAATGVGVRTLQQGFRTYLGTTPMTYLRRVRLARAYAELLAAAPGETSVSQVALRWGFTHHSRFAAAYRAAYGETPSTTLRRRATTWRRGHRHRQT
jgi:transcriptional regulator GlxA family with amidase domain